MDHIFRAYDIRGIWNVDLDPAKALDIGFGLGAFLRRDLSFDKVALGRDIRSTSRTMEGALSAGILASGIDILDTGEAAFGVTMMAGWKEGADASVYITASHLEPEWNGLKVYFGNGVGFPEEHIRSIGERVRDRRFSPVGWDQVGRTRAVDYLKGYISFWKRSMGRSISRAKDTNGIGIDCGGGAMCLSAPALFSALSVPHTDVNCEVDPTFSARGSEPKPKRLTELRDAVVDGGLMFGTAFDGDGDRAVVVDDKGRFMSSDRLGVVIAKHLVEENGGGEVLANVESSRAMEDVLEPLGAEVTRIKVGHTFLTLEAKERGALFGVEKSGHFIIPRHVIFDDAMTAPLELLRVVLSRGKPLSSIADEVPEYPTHSEAVDCPDDVKFSVVAALAKTYREKFARVNEMDGVRVDLDKGWALIRCSNTSPVIRLTIEAMDKPSLDGMVTEFMNDLSSAIDENARRV
jgi:phosphomannomutase